jgi:hypothetical protein
MFGVIDQKQEGVCLAPEGLLRSMKSQVWVVYIRTATGQASSNDQNFFFLQATSKAQARPSHQLFGKGGISLTAFKILGWAT